MTKKLKTVPKVKNKQPTKASELGSRFKQTLVDVANDVGKLPGEVTFAEYANSSLEGLTDWELRTLGGFKQVQKLIFPSEKNPIVGEASKMVRSYRSKIDAHYGREIFLTDEIMAVLKEVLLESPIKLHAPVKNTVKKSADKEQQRVLVAHLSDLHFGTNISKSELSGINEFNWEIAARRMALFMDQVVTYKPQYRDSTELVIGINGDIIGGVIHDQEWAVDLLTTQIAGALNILSQAISYAAGFFNKVKVVCTAGNHGRAFHKSSKDRATVHKWDSYENILFVALREILKQKHSNIEFDIPESPYAVMEILGHHFLQTHGDGVINVGNPGRNLNIRSINEQINKFNSSDIMHKFGKKKLAGVLVGHVHTPTVIMLESGTMLLINGCLSGVDGFAQTIGIFNNHPTQQLFEVTKSHAVGDMRFISVKEADSQDKFDKIIAPFKTKF